MKLNLYYWMNSEHGPKKWVAIFSDFSYKEFNIKDREKITEINNKALDIICLLYFIEPTQTWTYEGECQRGKIYGSDYKTIKDSIESFKEKRTKENEEFQLLEKNPELKLEEELKNHDWYADYSDDFSVTNAGWIHWNLIVKLMRQISIEKSKELFKKYAPKDFTFPNLQV